jgi:hypothetical protein
MKHKAIYNLYPNVKMIDESNNGSITAYDENREVVSIDMSAVDTKATELQLAENAKEQAKIDAKVSGNQKLLDLGLTQAEATALTGYTPPVAE